MFFCPSFQEKRGMKKKGNSGEESLHPDISKRLRKLDFQPPVLGNLLMIGFIKTFMVVSVLLGFLIRIWLKLKVIQLG